MTNRDKISMAVGLVGLASLVTGVCLVSIPAGCIVGGAFLLAWSYLLAKTATE